MHSLDPAPNRALARALAVHPAPNRAPAVHPGQTGPEGRHGYAPVVTSS
jgi:hypothetical protein